MLYTKINRQLGYLCPPDEPRPRRFYMLPTILKPPSEWSIPNQMPKCRPIISNCNTRASIRFPISYIPPGKSDSLRSKHRQDRGKHGSILSNNLLITVNKLTNGFQLLFIQPCKWLLVTYSASGVSNNNMSLRKPTHDTLGAMD